MKVLDHADALGHWRRSRLISQWFFRPRDGGVPGAGFSRTAGCRHYGGRSPARRSGQPAAQGLRGGFRSPCRIRVMAAGNCLTRRRPRSSFRFEPVVESNSFEFLRNYVRFEQAIHLPDRGRRPRHDEGTPWAGCAPVRSPGHAASTLAMGQFCEAGPARCRGQIRRTAGAAVYRAGGSIHLGTVTLRKLASRQSAPRARGR